jgi:hypothetical protein
MSESALSHESSTMEAAFSPDKLLELSDAVRESIALQGRLASSTQLMQQLVLFLETNLSEENRGVPSIEYNAIKAAHLDRLLKDIDEQATRNGIQSAKTSSYVNTARTLQRAWQTRFGGDWFKLDEKRTLDLVSSGRLREVSFVTPTRLKPTPHTWKVRDNMGLLTDVEGNSHFQIGQ